ncbi:hypothetical protein R1sor_023372 [Riccia sorocarpa]|uniref:Uncharacterized protein n=1 Tax=Riccia sorocarpa TaxID=122646 RepID=A0ABD3GP96_9MARC
MGKQCFLGLDKGVSGDADPAYPDGSLFNFMGFGSTVQEVHEGFEGEVKNGCLCLQSWAFEASSRTLSSRCYDVLESNSWRDSSKPVYVLAQDENRLLTMRTRRARSELESELNMEDREDGVLGLLEKMPAPKTGSGCCHSRGSRTVVFEMDDIPFREVFWKNDSYFQETLKLLTTSQLQQLLELKEWQKRQEEEQRLKQLSLHEDRLNQMSREEYADVWYFAFTETGNDLLSALRQTVNLEEHSQLTKLLGFDMKKCMEEKFPSKVIRRKRWWEYVTPGAFFEVMVPLLKKCEKVHSEDSNKICGFFVAVMQAFAECFSDIISHREIQMTTGIQAACDRLVHCQKDTCLSIAEEWRTVSRLRYERSPGSLYIFSSCFTDEIASDALAAVRSSLEEGYTEKFPTVAIICKVYIEKKWYKAQNPLAEVQVPLNLDASGNFCKIVAKRIGLPFPDDDRIHGLKELFEVPEGDVGAAD